MANRRFRPATRFSPIARLAVAGGALALVVTGWPAAASAPADQSAVEADCAVDPARELFVRDLTVVNDCARTTWGPCATDVPDDVRGAWTFGRLMEGIAGTTDPARLSKFTLDWLAHWESTQHVNGFDVDPRPRIRDIVTGPWLSQSGGKILDMKKAPFRLLAIVARLDLRAMNGYGRPSSAGEGRFVFGVLDMTDPRRVPLFTVILEYNLKAATCEEIKGWARDWHNLGTLRFGETYNRALEAITDRFSGRGADPQRPNGSSINQVRSNDFELSRPWELREFVLSPASIGPVGSPAPLVQTTVKQTPDTPRWNGEPLVAAYINEFEADILAGRHVVPATYQDENFLGGASENNIDFWDAPGIANNQARHLFSLNTCNACHGRETDTRFLHVEPRAVNEVARVSGFVSGITVFDPVSNEPRLFNELDFRSRDLCRLIETSCEALSAAAPSNRVH